MLTTNKRGAAPLWLAVVLAALLLTTGCGPDGASLLIEGDRLLREGKPEAALEKLQQTVTLLPKNARAWNHLGLAQHASRRPADAARSYQRALQLDPNLSEARYNLGCLYLEQGRPADAAQELASYTVFQRDSPDGWVKLGCAQMAAGQWNAATNSFLRAHQLAPRDPAVLNGVGALQWHARNPRAAADFFHAALRERPGYAPALLNLAILTQQHTTNQAAALKLYRDYLALQPRPANWAAVEEVARRLEMELQPAPTALTAAAHQPEAKPPLQAAPPPAPQTDALAAPAVAQTPKPAPVTAAKPQRGVEAEPPPARPADKAKGKGKTIVTPLPEPEPATVAAPAAPPSSAPSPAKPRPESKVVVVNPPPLPVSGPTAESTPKASPPQPQQAATTPPLAQAPARPAVQEQSKAPSPRQTVPEAETTGEKRSLLSRLNPLNLFRSPDKRTTPLPGDPARKPPSTPATAPAVPLNRGAVESSATAAASTPTSAPVRMARAAPAPQPPPRPVVTRYKHIDPPRPEPGNRTLAQQEFDRAARAWRAQDFSTALEAYRLAAQSDPAFFEAHFHLAVAALHVGDLRRALTASEFALALKPDSAEARHNFALALMRANYPLDAALELRKVIAMEPGNAQAHFTLAGIYARQLDDMARAKEHYRRVLEIDPRHPHAEAIRYWLAGQK